MEKNICFYFVNLTLPTRGIQATLTKHTMTSKWAVMLFSISSSLKILDFDYKS